jgi:hypothetical protein
MQYDKEPEIRLMVVEHMSPEAVVQMLSDEDWRVRLTAVEKAPLEAIAGMVDDGDEDVRAVVRLRLAETSSE